MFSLLIILLLVVVLAIGCRVFLRLETESQLHHTINQQLTIMAENQNQLAAEIRQTTDEVRSSTTQTLKGVGEIKDKITRLEEIIAQGGPLSEEVKTAFAELRAAVTSNTGAAREVDDVVPDSPPAAG